MKRQQLNNEVPANADPIDIDQKKALATLFFRHCSRNEQVQMQDDIESIVVGLLQQEPNPHHTEESEWRFRDSDLNENEYRSLQFSREYFLWFIISREVEIYTLNDGMWERTETLEEVKESTSDPRLRQHVSDNTNQSGGKEEEYGYELMRISKVAKKARVLCIRNLDPAIQVTVQKQVLREVFAIYGEVLEVNIENTHGTNRRAFIKFKDKDSAATAHNCLQRAPLFHREIEIQYVKDEVIQSPRAISEISEELMLTDNVLAVVGLTSSVTKETLTQYFAMCEGFKEVHFMKMRGTALVEYENKEQAKLATQQLNGIPITDDYSLIISYDKN
jgi:hypothetical protein